MPSSLWFLPLSIFLFHFHFFFLLVMGPTLFIDPLALVYAAVRMWIGMTHTLQ